MALPTPEEIDAMMAADSGGSSPISTSISSLPAPDEVDAMMAAEQTPSLFKDPIGALTSADWWTTGIDGSRRNETLNQLFKKPIKSLTSSDWWLTRPSGEVITPKQAVVGAPLAALDTLTAGLGDEIVASGSTLFSPNSYEQQLQEVRAIQENTPIVTKLATGIAASRFLPMPTMSKAPGTKEAIKNIAKAGTVGTGYGFGYGFGQGEGGFENRLESAAEGAKYGGLFSLGGQTLGEAVEGVGNFITKQAPKLNRLSLGATKSDYNKTVDELGLFDLALDDDIGTATRKALDKFANNPAVKQTRDPKELLKIATIKQSYADSEVLNAIKDWEKRQPKANFSKAYPKFDSVKKWIKSGEVEADKVDDYLGRVASFEKALKEKGKGSLSYLQQQKQVLAKKYDPKADSVEKAYIRQMYRQMKDAIEKRVPEVKKLNQESGEMQLISPILKKGLTAQESENFLDTFKRQGLATTGGMGALGLLTGDPITALALASSGYLATTPSGRQTLSSTFKKGGELIGKSTPAIQKANQFTMSQSGRVMQEDEAKNKSLYSPQSTFSLPTQGPTVMPKADDIDLDSIPKKKADRVAFIESQIDSDPIDAAIYEIESGRNPLAKNPTSSASGAFQLINKTAKKLGVEDPFDIAQNYKGYLKLKEEHQGVLRKLGIDENDPEALYSLHYLGSPTFKKLINGSPLTEQQAAQVRYLESKVLPRFRKVYQSKLTNV